MIDEVYFRIAVIASFLTAMAVSVFFRSRAATRQMEHVHSSGALVLMRITFALTLLAFLTSYALKPEWVAWASLPLPDGIRITGGGLVLLATFSFVWLFRHIGANITPTANTLAGHHLVTSGPYRWVRHPLYSAGFLFWFGMALLSATWLLLVFVGFTIMFIAIRMPREERNLEAEFGDAYRDYAAKTGRLLPRIFAR